jgi:tetratricopeptide (TPR) repeat protein
MQNLPLPDQRHLDAAEGWLSFGDIQSANEELAQISPDLRAHPHVLELRYQIYAETKRWDLAVEMARIMAESLPNIPWGHFHLAYSLHELKLTQAAYETLRPVVDRFPEEWRMRFNLACYACQLGKLEEAVMWLEQAMALAGKKEICGMALAAPDLEPLWDKIGEI